MVARKERLVYENQRRLCPMHAIQVWSRQESRSHDAAEPADPSQCPALKSLKQIRQEVKQIAPAIFQQVHGN